MSTLMKLLQFTASSVVLLLASVPLGAMVAFGQIGVLLLWAVEDWFPIKQIRVSLLGGFTLILRREN